MYECKCMSRANVQMDTRGSAESREHNTIINHQSHESFAPLHSQMGLRLPHPPVFQVGIARGDNEETKALILRAHFQEACARPGT